MTDDTTTQAPTPAPKKMWTRCNGCQQRIYNESLDIKIHAAICPQDMLLAIQKLRITVLGDPNTPKDPNSLVNRTSRLEETVGDLDEHIASEPALDPDGVDPDAYSDVLNNADEFDEQTPTAAVPATTHVNAPPAYTPAIDRDDDDTYNPFPAQVTP